MSYTPFKDEQEKNQSTTAGQEYEPKLYREKEPALPMDEETAVKKAEIHKKATRISKLIPEDKIRSGEFETCECCGLAVSEKSISMFAPLKKFYHLGPSIPLYLDYVSNASLFLLILLLFYGLFSIMTYSSGDYCKIGSGECPRSFFNYFSLANILDDPVSSGHWIQDILMVVVLLTLIVYSNISAFQHESIATDIDLMNDTPSDYTIRITGLPLDEDHEIIEKELYSVFGGYGLDIVKVVVVHDVKKHINTIRKWKRLESEISEDLTESTKKQYDAVFRKMKTLFDKGKLNAKLTGNAFLILNKQSQVELLLQNENTNWAQRIFGREKVQNEKDGQIFEFPTYFTYKGKRIFLNAAPEPSDVFWENLSVSLWKRLPNLILTFFVSISIISVTVFILFWLNKKQIMEEKEDLILDENQKQDDNEFDINIIQKQLLPMSIAGLNIIVRLILKVLVSFERPQTYTEYMLDATIWQIIVKFITSVIVIMMITIVDSVKEPLYMINNLMINIMVVNALLPSVINMFVDPDYLIHLWNKHGGKLLLKKKKITQEKLNVMFEYPELDLIDRYSTVYLTTLLACAFAPVAPLCIIIGLVGVVLMYLSDKYIISRRSSISKDLSGNLSFAMTLRFDVCIVVFILSEWFWDKKFVDGREGYEQPSVVYYILLTIVIIYILTPMRWLLKDFAMSKKKKLSQTTYFEMQQNFREDYDQKNPSTYIINWHRTNSNVETEENFQNIVEYAERNDLTQSVRKNNTKDIQASKKRLNTVIKNPGSNNLNQQNIAFRRYHEAHHVRMNRIPNFGGPLNDIKQ